MGKEYQEITPDIERWLKRQRVFFVATAPLADNGRINCSPKGMDTFRVLGPRELVYADIGGSGIETVAHLKENARVVIMLCAFEGPPKIFRFYGQGRSVAPNDPEFDQLLKGFADLPAVRNFVVIDVDCIRDSCGYGVPLYEFRAERDSLRNWCENKSLDEIREYRRQNNAASLDGLPGLDVSEIR